MLINSSSNKDYSQQEKLDLNKKIKNALGEFSNRERSKSRNFPISPSFNRHLMTGEHVTSVPPLKIYKIGKSNPPQSTFRSKYSTVNKEEMKCDDINCKNKILISRYESVIQELLNENDRLKVLNEFLMKNTSKKDEFLHSVIKKNSSLVSEVTNLEKINKEDAAKSIRYKTRKETETSKQIKTFPEETDKTLTQSKSSRMNQSRTNENINLIKNISSRKLQASSKFVVDKKSNNNRKTKTYYDEIVSTYNKKMKRENPSDVRASFLNINDKALKKIHAQENIKELVSLTNNDDDFINAMRTFTDEKLTRLSDSISTTIKDYEYCLNLILRIKRFLVVTVRVVNTLIIEDAINMLIKNACEILNCERTSIHVHDKYTNMLVIHAGEGLNKGEWKVPVDKGIVGAVFSNGEKQKIDDAYLDERFNKEIDKKTGFKTKTMLCVPLKYESGECFGVIQSLNKKKSLLFSPDDEELMDIFAKQAAIILKNSMKFDENLSYSSRLKMLVNFSLEIHSCADLYEFTSMAENLLNTFWGVNVSQILILEGTSSARHFDTEEPNQIKPSSVGLVGKVIKKREMIAISSVYNNKDFNNLVDIETGFSLVTFPMSDNNDDHNILAVGQLGYPFKIFQNTSRPQENDVDVIKFFSVIASFWLTNYFIKQNANLS